MGEGVGGMMSAFAPAAAKTRRRHNRWLVLIAIYKGLQALLFVAIGVGALHMLHRDIADDFATLADHLNFNPESRFVNFVLDKLSLIDDPLLKRIGAVALSYAGVSFAEGIGLYLEKAWGEYLTLAITISFLPWEIFEIAHRITWFRFSLLLINVLVLFYLAKVVTQQARERRMWGKKSVQAEKFTVSSPYPKAENSASVVAPSGTKRVNQHN
ncbi:MAG TPA: DUF2127 domain-containing protein [Terracidiphilus sp.]|nr:DUF2127 domain-containing protein [Terracidiphilus sp.]